MALVLHNLFDMDDSGKLMPGYIDENRTWVLKPDAITLEYVQGAYNSSVMRARKAEQKLLAEMPRSPDGWIADTCGSAWVEMYRPCRKLLNLLKKADVVRQGCYRGQWIFNKHAIKEQSITVHEEAMEAMAKVLSSAFPGEDIHAHSWID